MQAIITADWHLRSDRPRCRLDEDWAEFQRGIVNEIVHIANERHAPIVIVGDIFHTPQVTDRIKRMIIQAALNTQNSLYALAGNHDLAYHCWDNVETSSYGILDALRGTVIFHPEHLGRAAHFGEEPTGPDNGILFIHQLVFPSAKDMPPNTEAVTAHELMAEHPEAEWIFTGDYHRAFHVQHTSGGKTRNVVNPGCITRQAADMMEYKPSVYYVDTESGTVEQIFLPDTGPMVTDEYLRDAEEREGRVTAFVESIRSSGTIQLDFLQNVNAAMAANKDLAPGTVNMIQRLLEEGRGEI